MAPGDSAYVHDVRAVLGDVFAELRLQADQSGNRDVVDRLGDPAVAKALFSQLVQKPKLPVGRAEWSSDRARGAGQSDRSAVVAPWKVLTWNVNQVHQPVSSRAPQDGLQWTAEENLKAVVAEVLRWRPDVLTLQEQVCKDDAGNIVYIQK